MPDRKKPAKPTTALARAQDVAHRTRKRIASLEADLEVADDRVARLKKSQETAGLTYLAGWLVSLALSDDPRAPAARKLITDAITDPSGSDRHREALDTLTRQRQAAHAKRQARQARAAAKAAEKDSAPAQQARTLSPAEPASGAVLASPD